eukprot:2723980-Alexandrium_andersonii.AAC.1
MANQSQAGRSGGIQERVLQTKWLCIFLRSSAGQKLLVWIAAVRSKLKRGLATTALNKWLDGVKAVTFT